MFLRARMFMCMCIYGVDVGVGDGWCRLLLILVSAPGDLAFCLVK